MGLYGRWLHRFSRRKQLEGEELEKTDLARCLNTFDLTALGVGSTLGAGAYVIAGTVAKANAGPAVILSFLIAAFASVLAGLCYAEFGARVPKAGSAYVYTYVSVGEFLAFVIGWDLILEYVIGAASVARTFSGYFDDLAGHKIIPFFNSTMTMHVDTLAPYFDPLALGITFLVTVILAVGVKESAWFTNIFTAMNLCVLTFICIAGAFKDDPGNWGIPENEVPDSSNCSRFTMVELQSGVHGCCGRADGCGTGGFAPYGFTGVIRGAATCFFAFVGFDAIATTGEEVINPQKAIPLAILGSLLIVFVFYSGISLTLTMMLPYFELSNTAPFSQIFEHIGWDWAKYIVSIGAICALCTSLLGAMFPMPRVVLAMGRDGVIFRFFAAVHPRLKTPLIATLVSGTFACMSFGAMFPMTRVVLAMGRDGVIFCFFAAVHPRLKTPLIATLVSGTFACMSFGAMFPMTRVVLAMGRDGVIFCFFAAVHPRLKTPLIATLVSGTFACMSFGAMFPMTRVVLAMGRNGVIFCFFAAVHPRLKTPLIATLVSGTFACMSFGAMFPMTRVVLAMGRDGVIFCFFAAVHPRLKTPLIATLVSGTFACMSFGAMFPMTRVVLAMGRDGVIFCFFAAVHPRLKTPLIATLVSGTFACMSFGAMFPMTRVVLAMGRDGVIFCFFAAVHPRLKTPLIATLVSGTFACMSFGAMFPMTRVVLAMGRDGVIFCFFAAVHSRLKTPLIATLVSGTFASLMAALFDVDALVNMMSIGTLMAYTLVAACVLLLRYDVNWDREKCDISEEEAAALEIRLPTPASLFRVRILLTAFVVAVSILSAMLAFGVSELGTNYVLIAAVVVFTIISIGLLVAIYFQPLSPEKLPFMVPLIPWFPGLSIFFNIYLMLNLDWMTWVRYAGWFIMGQIMYLAYGVWHSTEEH